MLNQKTRKPLELRELLRKLLELRELLLLELLAVLLNPDLNPPEDLDLLDELIFPDLARLLRALAVGLLERRLLNPGEEAVLET